MVVVLVVVGVVLVIGVVGVGVTGVVVVVLVLRSSFLSWFGPSCEMLAFAVGKLRVESIYICTVLGLTNHQAVTRLGKRCGSNAQGAKRDCGNEFELHDVFQE